MMGLATSIIGTVVLAALLGAAALVHHWEGAVKATTKLQDLRADSERRLEAESEGRADLESELDHLAGEYATLTADLDEERAHNADLRRAIAGTPDLDELRRDPAAFLEHFSACPSACYALRPEALRAATQTAEEDK